MNPATVRGGQNPLCTQDNATGLLIFQAFKRLPDLFVCVFSQGFSSPACKHLIRMVAFVVVMMMVFMAVLQQQSSSWW